MLSWIGFFRYSFMVSFNFWGRGGGGVPVFLCVGGGIWEGGLSFNVCNVSSFKL